jgi:hypothetical protein
MTPNEFVIWLKGFTQAANNFTCTPKQWDDIKEQLDKVISDNYIKGTRYNLDKGSWNVSTTSEGRNEGNILGSDDGGIVGSHDGIDVGCREGAKVG